MYYEGRKLEPVEQIRCIKWTTILDRGKTNFNIDRQKITVTNGTQFLYRFRLIRTKIFYSGGKIRYEAREQSI